MKQQGLRDNPFGQTDAQYEDNIRDYYVPVQDLYIETLLARPSPWIVFAAVGRGKTALRKMVASECWPANRDSKVLAVEFENRAWRALQELAESPSSLQPIDYAQAIVRLAHEQLQQAPRGTLASLAPLRSIVAAPPASLRPQSCLDQLRDLAGALGFSRVVCLVDELDNAFPDVSVETMLDWVRPLLVLEIRNCLTFRYFLPDTVDEPLLRESKRLGLSACHVTRVRWRESNLIELLGQRMRAFSADRTDPRISVGQLCEEKLARVIDREIAQTAEGSPRAAIYLADKLLNLHYQGPDVPLRVQPSAWHDAQDEWQVDRERILGAGLSFGGEGDFLLKGRRIYFAGSELHLIERDYLLLRRLIEDGGQACSLRDLAAAGWPGANPDGVRDKTVQEAVRRMKERLKEQRVDPAWVDAVAGRGYRLRVPEGRATKQAKAPGQEETPPSTRRAPQQGRKKKGKTPGQEKPPSSKGRVPPRSRGKGGRAPGRQETPRSSDVYSPLEAGLEEMKRRLNDNRPAYEEALLYETRLRENIAKARRYGDKPALESGRAEVIDRLNALCSRALGVYFTELLNRVSASDTPPSISAPNQVDSILIVTVTKVETQAVQEAFAQAAGKKSSRHIVGNKTYYHLGIHGGAPVFMVQSEMGTATPGGALLTVRQAIQDLRPQAVIMCGVAFGLRPHKQKLGDILVAKQLQCYEPQKVALQDTIPRGDRVASSERLLDRFRSGDNDWKGAQTHFGLVLSGEKLVNDPAFRDWLLKHEPEAIGGEMEGAGLYVAARDAKAEWILVKGICDWADGEKNDDAQPPAARNAARFVLHVLRLGGWDRPEQLRERKDEAGS